jgi:sec-independent protein translocase protein TatB
MLPSMFGMGGSEILVILVVALIFLGPEKLPDAATKISKGIRELRRQTREVQQTIENDTEFGGAIRDLKSALRGDEIRPKVRQALAPLTDAAKDVVDTANGAVRPAPKEPLTEASVESPAAPDPIAADVAASPALPTLPPSAGEHADPDAAPPTAEDDAELAKLIRPAAGTVAHAKTPKSADDHG